MKEASAMVFRESTMQTITKSEYIHPNNTRSIGQRIHIDLTKGHEGLGFSVTTRDNMPGTEIPVYVKAILPRGPALTDGRLRSWDRILTVNGIEMTGRSQKEAVQVLREIPVGSVVRLVVSRQTDQQLTSPEDQPPTEMAIKEVDPPCPVLEEKTVSPSKARVEVVIERRGRKLGVAVRGKTVETERGNVDSGIYIRAINCEGAAALDGRVNVNDQLLEVNGRVLTGMSNADALEKLRSVLQMTLSSNRVALVLGRRRRAPAPPSAAHQIPSGQRMGRPGNRSNLLNASARSLDNLLYDETDGDAKNGVFEDIDPMVAFSREGFGRKSMSEKRKGHLDPRFSEVYRKIRSSRSLTPIREPYMRRTLSLCALDKTHRLSDILFSTRL